MTTPIKYPEIYAELRRNPTESPASVAARLGHTPRTVGHVRARMIKAGIVQNIADKSGIVHPEIYAAIRSNPTETPVSIANRLGVSSRLVGHIRSRMIANGEVQAISTKSNRPIDEDERMIIIGLRQRGFSYPNIAAKVGRSRGIIERICVNARASGELKPIDHQPREAVQRAIEMVEKPRMPRLSMNMTETEERAVMSLQNTLRHKTTLELLTMVRGRMRR
jgi:hypothetical protein